MGDRPMIVDSTAVGKDLNYEPPLVIAWGVDSHTVGSDTITMGRTIVPPGARNQAHRHKNCEAVFYVAKGSIRVRLGEEREEHVVPQGCFIYSPKGFIHGIENMSKTEEAELIFTYGNCPDRDAAGTEAVEGPQT
ncbi:MAG: cupin domain-containing protein [Dehalococcoidia bacterium]